MRIIEVIVSPQGEVKVTTRGFAGADCLAATKALEQALGSQTAEQKTTEFYASTEAAQKQEAQS